jgi:hypothetical protein
MKIDVQGRHSFDCITKFNLSRTAPGQKCGVILSAINQLEHAFG